MKELAEFMHWGSQFRNFPYGQFSYWMAAYRRDDGKDMYGQTLEGHRHDQTPAATAIHAIPAAGSPPAEEA